LLKGWASIQRKMPNSLWQRQFVMASLRLH
jgi:hypothetical protein